MKKNLNSIISLILCLMLAACNSDKTQSKYRTFVCDCANDGLTVNIEKDGYKDWWGKDETNSTAPETKQATFDGVDYSSSYLWSDIPASRHNMRDKYINEDRNAELSFNSLSGEFAGIYFYYTWEKYEAADIENSHVKALEQAKQLASGYINPDEYVLTETQYPYYNDGEGNAKIGQHGEGRITLYDFTFTKKLNGFDTSDSFAVSITSKGDLQAFHAYDTGLFEQRDVPEIDKDELGKSIDEKLKEIYSKYEYTYEIEKQTLTLSPEEKTIVVSQIALDVKDKCKTGILLATEIE